MDSKRSTRRSVNPPESEQETVTEDTPGSLTDVESILDEIESLVAGGGNEATAKRTSVVESQGSDEPRPETGRIDVESEIGTQDVAQLNVDLDAAIAAELNQIEREIDSDPEQREIEDETANPDPDSTVVEIPNAEDEVSVEPTTEELVCSESTCTDPGVAHRLMMFMSGPIPSLSSGSRTVVSIFAVSLAIWVPLIWMLALNSAPLTHQESLPNGVDSLSSPDVDETDPPAVDD